MDEISTRDLLFNFEGSKETSKKENSERKPRRENQEEVPENTGV